MRRLLLVVALLSLPSVSSAQSIAAVFDLNSLGVGAVVPTPIDLDRNEHTQEWLLRANKTSPEGNFVGAMWAVAVQRPSGICLEEWFQLPVTPFAAPQIAKVLGVDKMLLPPAPFVTAQLFTIVNLDLIRCR